MFLFKLLKHQSFGETMVRLICYLILVVWYNCKFKEKIFRFSTLKEKRCSFLQYSAGDKFLFNIETNILVKSYEDLFV